MRELSKHLEGRCKIRRGSPRLRHILLCGLPKLPASNVSLLPAPTALSAQTHRGYLGRKSLVITVLAHLMSTCIPISCTSCGNLVTVEWGCDWKGTCWSGPCNSTAAMIYGCRWLTTQLLSEKRVMGIWFDPITLSDMWTKKPAYLFLTRLWRIQ